MFSLNMESWGMKMKKQKTITEILREKGTNQKGKLWAIYDEQGNKLKGGFRHLTTARRECSRLKINKHEKLEVRKDK